MNSLDAKYVCKVVIRTRTNQRKFEMYKSIMENYNLLKSLARFKKKIIG